MTGNFQEALEDAKRAREFQPTYMKAILRGNRNYISLVFIQCLERFFVRLFQIGQYVVET